MDNGSKPNLRLIILIIILVVLLFNSGIFPQNDLTQKSADAIDAKLKNLSGNFYLTINPLSEYDFLSKEEFYNLRRKFVKTSLFGTSFYNPSKEVFGQIESSKPWYGITYSGCITKTLGTPNAYAGLSEESRFVNNPNILVGVTSGSYNANINHPICTDPSLFVVPSSMYYSSSDKTITTTYYFRHSLLMALNGINARDLGYSYVYASDINNINFENQPNISNSVYEFTDFIHLGSSCQLEGGCNNASPYQPYLDFRINSFPASLTMKLWHKQPKSASDKADIQYKIIFK